MRAYLRTGVNAGIALFFGLAFAGPANAARCYVKADASSGNAGTSWTMATTLQSALADNACSEIWVAAGVYKPSVEYNTWGQTGPRARTFNIRAGTAVYGGFAGTETQLSERDPAQNQSILSGDIDDNDLATIAASTADIQGANAYHVVTMDGSAGDPIFTDTVLDGFVITAGSAIYPGGGGLLCDASMHPQARCQPTLEHLLFSGNLATDKPGGALLNHAIYGGKASPTILNSTFVGNQAMEVSGSSAQGGAIYNEGYGGQASPVLINDTFVGNSARDGGAIYNSGYDGISNPLLINVTFTGNSASGCGGAVYSDGSSGGASVPGFVNVIAWGDQAGVAAGSEFCSGATGTPGSDPSANPFFEHSIVQGSGGSGSGWTLPFGADAGGNLDVDPRLGMLSYQGGFVPTIAFGPGSPALDAGEDGLCPASDARDVSRPYGAHCDIGAIESNDYIFADGFE